MKLNLLIVLIIMQNAIVLHSLVLKKTRKHKFPSSLTFSNNLSASYTHYRNWKYNGLNNYAFLLKSNLNYDTVGNNWEGHVRLNAELGYMKFIDSTWQKNNDYLDISADFVKSSKKRLENIFTFYFNTQFLSDYEMYYDDKGAYCRRWTSGFGNPMNIELGYGTTVNFWKTCRINLTFVTLRTSTSPLLDPPIESKKNEMVYKNAVITSEYGLGIQTYIRKNVAKRIRWENYSRAFANAIHREKFNIDFRNRLIVKTFKYLDLIVDSRIRYMPLPPYKFQFRNELMLSFTFERI